MIFFYLIKIEYNFVCVVKVCVDFLKIFFIDILINVIKLVDFYSEILKFILFLIIGIKKFN